MISVRCCPKLFVKLFLLSLVLSLIFTNKKIFYGNNIGNTAQYHFDSGVEKMSIIIIRSLILYILVVFSVRLMGKRQLGELQPSELVITILVSNIATLPLEDTDIPVIVGVTPILSLVCFEVIVSWLILKLPSLRKVISGSPKIIISNGKINRKILRELRFSVDDLMTALRGQQIFDLSEIQYAIVETTGSVSVMKKQTEDTPTREDLNLKAEIKDPPQVIVSDGKIMRTALDSLGYNEEFVKKRAREAGIKTEEIFIMTADSMGECYISSAKDGRSIKIGGKDDKD